MPPKRGPPYFSRASRRAAASPEVYPSRTRYPKGKHAREMLTAAGEVAPCAQHCSGMSAVAGPVTHCKEAALESPPIWERFSSKLVLVKKENYARVVKNCSKTMILLNLSNLSVATFARRSLRYICSRTSARASLICALTYSRTWVAKKDVG